MALSGVLRASKQSEGNKKARAQAKGQEQDGHGQ
jgi:hypothetical protein